MPGSLLQGASLIGLVKGWHQECKGSWEFQHMTNVKPLPLALALLCPSRWPSTAFINTPERCLGPAATRPKSSCCRCAPASAWGRSICGEDVAQPQPRGERSSGSGFYYGPNDKTFCASVHMDSAPTASRDAVQSPLVSVLLTPVTGRLESGISLVMIFPSCPSLICPNTCWTLLSPSAWAGSETAFLSWAKLGWNLETHPLLGGMSKPPWELLRRFGLPKDIAFSLIQEERGLFL